MFGLVRQTPYICRVKTNEERRKAMPRKTDGMKFELLPRPTKGEDGKPLLYPRPAKGFKYTQRALDEYCNKYRATQVGDMVRLFECFLDAAATLMRDGSRVETEIGSFAPKLKLDGDYTDPKKVKNQSVSLAGIEFIPSKRFVETLEDKIHFGFVQKQEVYERHPVNDPKELEKILEKCLRIGYTTVERFQWATDLKYLTAKRYLDGLCKGDNPRLRKYKEGTTNHYIWKEKSSK